MNLESVAVNTSGAQTVLALSHQYGKVQELTNRSRTDTVNNTSKTDPTHQKRPRT